MHFVFIYPQLKNLTGAQRLILSLAEAVSELPDQNPPHRVTLLTHNISIACRQALPPSVQVVETGSNLNRTGNHYLDSLLEYLSVPFLLKYLGNSVKCRANKIDATKKALASPPEAICFFGPPSLPGLWWAKKVLHLKIPLLYFCYEPPRAAYTDILEVSNAWAGNFGRFARFLFRLYRPVDRYFAKQASGILVNGLYAQGLIRETYGLPSTIITHGVNFPPLKDKAEAAAMIRARHNLENKKLILTVNHLHPRKRVDLQLLALSLLLKKEPQSALLVIGTGPEAVRLRQLATQLKLNETQVVFAGFVPEMDLPAYYAAADVYLHSGRAESFGLSVLEASASGLPVVAADEGGPKDIILEGETGFLVPANPENFADKIGWLFSNPQLALSFGQRGAETVANRFTWSTGAADFLSAFR